VILDPSSPSSCVHMRVEPGFVPCSFLQEIGVGAVPRCAGGGGSNTATGSTRRAPSARNAGTSACPAGVPQRRAATRTLGPFARVTGGRKALQPGASVTQRRRRKRLNFRRTPGVQAISVELTKC
jgi:hypothetical protein